MQTCQGSPISFDDASAVDLNAKGSLSMRSGSLIVVLYACSFLVSPALAQGIEFAPIHSPGATERTETRAYLGLSWAFGADAPARPDVVLGVQKIRVTSSDTLTGVDLNARFGLDGALSRIALAGLYGSRDFYANAGMGYDFRRRETFVTAAAQTARLRAGLDFGLRARRFVPYFEVNSLDRPDAVLGTGSVLSCSPGYVLSDGSGLSSFGQQVYDSVVDAGFDIDGTICIDPGSFE